MTVTGPGASPDGGDRTPPAWPPKYDIFGIGVTATTREALANVMIDAARRRVPSSVEALAVHPLVLAAGDSDFRRALRSFDAVAPDGQPVRFALDLLHGTRLPDRVRSIELTLRVCELAAQHAVKVYLYGSYPNVVAALKHELTRRFPRLDITGCEPGVYRPLTPHEDQALMERIERSGAGLVLIGLGCPRQEIFAYEHRGRIRGVQFCIGAAFDILCGHRAQAPLWMQRTGLEWLFRLHQEPRRLWRRYLDTNTRFVMRLTVAWLRRRRPPR